MVKWTVVMKSNPAFGLMTEGSHDKITSGNFPIKSDCK